MKVKIIDACYNDYYCDSCGIQYKNDELIEIEFLYNNIYLCRKCLTKLNNETLKMLLYKIVDK